VAFPRGLAPGEEAVPRQHNARGLGVLAAELFEPHTEFETRPLPRQPADLAAIDFRRQLAAVLRRRDGDYGIGMHVVHMLPRHEGMQRRINGSSSRIEVEGAV